MHELNLKPHHKPVKDYYANLQKLDLFHETKEGAVSPAFGILLREAIRRFNKGLKVKLNLIEQFTIKRNTHSIRVDGAVVDEYKLPHGYWEAKDTDDDLEVEIKKKFESGYPRDNIIFQSPDRISLWQHGTEIFNEDVSEVNKENLITALKLFFAYEPPAYDQWQKAIEEFKPYIPQLGEGLLEKIEHEYRANKEFREAFKNFFEQCQQSINPNLSKQAVEEMLIQHLMTERLFRTVFNNPDFTRHNIIAAEIEKVVATLTSHYFSRKEFLEKLDRFYVAVERAAETIDDYSQKQAFLNTVYEQFFQGFSVKIADTHGIVYTPQPIVNFMVNSVEDILKKEFGRSLSSENVHILDPFVGTGSFIIRIMREMKKTALPHKYRNELHCNEVMLLPYYIASMNIEHAFNELTGTYEPFEGICFVDTFELVEEKQRPLFVKANTERVERQKQSPIFVIIGNPPYNAGQVNENDNNKNRRYPVIDKRVHDTYAKDSKATLLRKLNDPYVKAIRWASDRIGEGGIVAFITNSSFLEDLSFDGMRKHLAEDFDAIYILDLSGNVRKNPKLSGTTHNVFGIQVGVSINLLIRKVTGQKKDKAKIHYARVGEYWRKEEKYDFLNQKALHSNIEWQEVIPGLKNNWFTKGISEDFKTFMPMGTKEAKRSDTQDTETIFKIYSTGVSTNRDAVVYDFNKQALIKRVRQFEEDYNYEVYRYIQKKKPQNVDEFVSYEKIKWSRNLKRHFRNGDTFKYNNANVRESLYRPFLKQYLYFSDIIVDELGYNQKIFPNLIAEEKNRVVCVSGVASFKPFHTLMTKMIPSLDSLEKTQCFPFYIYDEDGSNRRENITDWALKRFRKHYKDKTITKWDIFHYTYGLLHHPQYREKYAANLKRELPRIPFAPDFWTFAKAGKRLADLHVNYEDQPEYELEEIETGPKLDYRVEKMKLSKDKTQLIYNDFLTLAGIPEEVFEYRLGNRSALEWIVDQYRVKTDKRSGIKSDPNRADDPEYIIRLIKKVISVSLETMKMVNQLKRLKIV